jgi:hypothetical protein
MARLTGIPESECRICTRPDSCAAPIHTKSAMKISIGLP